MEILVKFYFKQIYFSSIGKQVLATNQYWSRMRKHDRDPCRAQTYDSWVERRKPYPLGPLPSSSPMEFYLAPLIFTCYNSELGTHLF
jgi:hypothetical protein